LFLSEVIALRVYRFKVPDLELVLLDTNQHVYCVVNFDTCGVNFLKTFFAELAEVALDRVKAIRHKIVGVFPVVLGGLPQNRGVVFR